MKPNDHEPPALSIAGRISPVQQAELNVLVAGRWPPLKPLPVFKLETDEYRASIDFDKLRGEWVCRKTSQLSNKVQELRSSLPEIARALPPAQTPAFAESPAAEQSEQERAPERELEPEQEQEKDATRRAQSVQEWKEKYDSGALYSALQDYLSESQQQEVADTLRLTLTARQLQCNPKNIAYVFDALAKAGGRFASLMEIAQRNRVQQQVADVPLKAKAATASLGAGTENISSSFPEEPTWNILPAHHQSSMPESAFALPLGTTIPPPHTTPPYSVMPQHRTEGLPDEPLDEVREEVLDGFPAGFAEEVPEEAREEVPEEVPEDGQPTYLATLQEKMYPHASVAAFASTVRAGKFDSSAAHIDSPSARPYVLEISGFQVIALVIFALLSLALGLAVGRGPLAKRLQNAQESMPGLDAISSPSLTHPSEVTPSISSPPHTNTADTPGNPPPSAVNPSASAVAPNNTTSLEARNAPPTPNPKPSSSPTVSPKTITPLSTAPPSLAASRPPATPLLAPRLSSVPSTMLVSGPGDGTKPFRLTLPERPIAASSSFAMTSQLSVLVSPPAGSAHKPTRLQAGQLISFVWPRYPRPGDRHASSETVKLRITVGNLGQVLDVQHLSGSHNLFPAASTAIRQWRYKPTLLNSKSVQAQHDVTIEFRPPQHSAFLPTRNPSRN